MQSSENIVDGLWSQRPGLKCFSHENCRSHNFGGKGCMIPSLLLYFAGLSSRNPYPPILWHLRYTRQNFANEKNESALEGKEKEPQALCSAVLA